MFSQSSMSRHCRVEKGRQEVKKRRPQSKTGGRYVGLTWITQGEVWIQVETKSGRTLLTQEGNTLQDHKAARVCRPPDKEGQFRFSICHLMVCISHVFVIRGVLRVTFRLPT